MDLTFQVINWIWSLLAFISYQFARTPQIPYLFNLTLQLMICEPVSLSLPVECVATVSYRVPTFASSERKSQFYRWCDAVYKKQWQNIYTGQKPSLEVYHEHFLERWCTVPAQGLHKTQAHAEAFSGDMKHIRRLPQAPRC